MKLSEAIRAGAKLRPMTKEGFYFNEGCSCSLGAAYEALTGKTLDHHEYSPETQREFGSFMQATFPILHDDKRRSGWSNFYNEVVYMNDKSHKTREQIADWLEAQGY